MSSNGSITVVIWSANSHCLAIGGSENMVARFITGCFSVDVLAKLVPRRTVKGIDAHMSGIGSIAVVVRCPNGQGLTVGGEGDGVT